MSNGSLAEATNYRVFFSYAWSSPTHQSWVVNLATRLREDGVDIVLDKWDLLPGHDSIKFMEQMVTAPDVTKVVMVCDKAYAEKADGRSGGVGTESQIISPEIYGNATQNKFAAVITEISDDGKAYVPTYYKGRIYFDFTVPDRSEQAYDELLRWLTDKPLHVKPALGAMPTFLSESKTLTIATTSRAKRAEDSIRQGSRSASGLLREFLDAFLLELGKLSPASDRHEHLDEAIVAAVEQFRPYIRQYQDLITVLARYDNDSTLIEAIPLFLERAAQLMSPSEEVRSWSSWDYDHAKIIVHDLFLSSMALLLREGRFELAARLTQAPYLMGNPRERSPGSRHTRNFSVFYEYPDSLEARNKRLNANRLSPQADMLAQSYKSNAPSFDEIMQADFILYLISTAQGDSWDSNWYPISLVYATRRFAPFEIFARAESAKYFERIKLILSVASAQELKERLAVLGDRNNSLKMGFHSVPVATLANAANLATLP